VTETANRAVTTAERLMALFREDEQRLAQRAGGASSSLRVYDAFRRRPVASIGDLAARAGVSFPTAARAVETLTALDIAGELTGRKRNRVFGYRRYLEILGEGTEPL